MGCGTLAYLRAPGGQKGALILDPRHPEVGTTVMMINGEAERTPILELQHVGLNLGTAPGVTLIMLLHLESIPGKWVKVEEM